MAPNWCRFYYRIRYRIEFWFYSKFPYRLTIPTLPLGPDYNKGETILYATFQLLTNFIEQETPDKHIDWNANPDHKHARDEMASLYYWWTVTRPARPTLSFTLEGVPGPTTFDEEWEESTFQGKPVYCYRSRDDKYPEYYAIMRNWHNIEREQDDEDDENLRRLIAVRRYMWT